MVAEVGTLTAASSLLQTWSGTIKYFYSVVKIFLLPSIARSEVAVRPNYFLISLVSECRVAAELSSLFTVFTPGPDSLSTHYKCTGAILGGCPCRYTHLCEIDGSITSLLLG